MALFRSRLTHSETPRCSFCYQGQDVVGKLMSAPSADPGVYICNECVAVCHSILEDNEAGADDSEEPRLLDDPVTPALLNAVNEWVERESKRKPAVHELNELRRLAGLLNAGGDE